MNPRTAVLLLVAAAALGCAARGRPFEEVKPVPPGHSVIYVYRPYSFFGSAIAPTVRCGSQSAAIRPGAYHAFVVPAGERISCYVETETADAVDFDGGPQIQYLRERIGLGLIVGRPQLNPIDADQAQSEIQTCCVEQP